ncbi:hypothetical protein CHS0354_011036 [Potamilus streckersoni]|uniref:Uncharacterized protein n=1 Tax=Potamilus streckersoni TaxID=2493646 RepID=A0AAE0TM58_9BIVA|nr:hypothetical protein CHS0354_011036 [Potamilus streckersoni]
MDKKVKMMMTILSGTKNFKFKSVIDKINPVLHKLSFYTETFQLCSQPSVVYTSWISVKSKADSPFKGTSMKRHARVAAPEEGKELRDTGSAVTPALTGVLPPFPLTVVFCLWEMWVSQMVKVKRKDLALGLKA